MPIFIERGDSVFSGIGGSRLFDHGFPFPRCGQPCDPKRGPQHLLGRGSTRVEQAYLLALRSRIIV
jgi:hypothetical protein